MTTYTDLEILENRLYWIQYLMEPGRKKAIGLLESIEDSEARCCLGHACHILIPESRNENYGYVYYMNEYSIAPSDVILMLGLWSPSGHFEKGRHNINGIYFSSLATLNDSRDKDFTPYEIGEYLQTVVMGGEDTPFKPIKI